MNRRYITPALLTLLALLSTLLNMSVPCQAHRSAGISSIRRQFAEKDATIAKLRREIELKDRVILGLYEKQKKSGHPGGDNGLDLGIGATSIKPDEALRWSVQYYNGRLELARAAHVHSLQMAEKGQDAAAQGNLSHYHMLQNQQFYANQGGADEVTMEQYLKQAVKRRKNLIQDTDLARCYKESDLCLPSNADNATYQGTGLDTLRFYIPR